MEISLITQDNVRVIIQEELARFKQELEETTKMDFPQSPDDRLTRHDLCKIYKISLPTVHKYMKSGLPFEKIGRGTRFRRSDVDKYFRETAKSSLS